MKHGARRGLVPATWLVLGGLAVALACATTRETIEPDPLTRPVAERLGPEELRIRWPGSFSQGPVTIFAAASPDELEPHHPVGFGRESSVIVDADELPRRPYFLLLPHDGGPGVITAERRLPLQGPDNFRDLGGYRTRDGRSVRWGRIYRSDDISSLTEDDVEYLSDLGLKLVCDFRSDRERRDRPSRAIEPDRPETLDLTIEVAGTDPGVTREKIRTGGIVRLEAERTMLTAYRSFVTDHSPEFAAMLARVARAENLPTLVHCTAGKDRTGFASALILLALGVPEETVMEDYLRTNFYLEPLRRLVLRWTPLYSLFRTDPEDILPLIEARPEYLQASLDAIADGYGSVDAYLREALGVGPELRASLRENLLR